MKEDQELLEGVLHRPDGVFSESWWPIFTQSPTSKRCSLKLVFRIEDAYALGPGHSKLVQRVSDKRASQKPPSPGPLPPA
jgi:hypothetical protein